MEQTNNYELLEHIMKIFDDEILGKDDKFQGKKLFELISQAVEALYPEKHQGVIEAIEIDYNAAKLKSLFSGLNLYAIPQVETVSKNKALKRQQQHMS